ELKAEALQAVADFGAHGGVVFANPACKHQEIKTAENRNVSGDNLLRRSGKHLDGEARAVVFTGGCAQLAHVAGEAGNSEETRFFVQEFLELRDIVSIGAKDVERNAGIQIPGTTSHDDAARRGEPHGRIDG